jgi:DNA-binding transcriptional LysR family regulator
MPLPSMTTRSMGYLSDDRSVWSSWVAGTWRFWYAALWAEAAVLAGQADAAARVERGAAAQGLGVALESTTTGNKHLAEGTLRPVLGMDKSIRVKAHFAVYPARHAKRPPVEAFLSWLHGEAAVQSSLTRNVKRT